MGHPTNKQTVTAEAFWCLQMGSVIYKGHCVNKAVSFINKCLH